MSKEVWYRYTFLDGTVSICMSMSRQELVSAIRAHGKVISKTVERVY